MKPDMPTNSDRMSNLENMRREWVEVTRKNRFQEGIADLLAHQYSQKTHFIFELLQNAEDAKATNVSFLVEKERLVFSHDGPQLFSDENVESITSIGESTKRDDYTQIGKHGIGFKAVFAYTHTPRIHSGDKHFDIVNVVVPDFLAATEIPPDLHRTETRIILPFDHEGILPDRRFRKLVPANQALEDISNALKQLSLRTVLFLRHIEKIRWALPNGSHGAVHRKSTTRIADDTRQVIVSDGNKDETWLIFERSIQVTDDGSQHQCIVEVAFMLKDNRVTCASNTELVVFFPTEKKTELGFLIQGPFKTTKARDNIALDNNANNQLIETAAQLAAYSLLKLREMNLFHLESFDALPLRPANFSDSSFFRPVYDEVRASLKNEKLLPRHGGGFVSAKEARLARGAKLTGLFSHEQLSKLLNRENCYWLDENITANNTPDLYTYLCGKKTYTWSTQWEQEPLVPGIQLEARDLAKKVNRSFFEAQDNSWLCLFYSYLEENFEPFKDTPFLRLQDGTHVAPGSNENPKAYLPPSEAAHIDQRIFPLVEASLAQNKDVRAFLVNKAKLREPDKIEEIIRSRLPKYEAGNLAFCGETYGHDLKAISEAFANAKSEEVNRLLEALKKVPFIASVAAKGFDGSIVWRKADDPSLFARNAQLEQWFVGNEDDEAWFSHESVEAGLSADLREKLGWARHTLLRRAQVHPGWSRSTHCKASEGFNAMLDLLGLEWMLNHLNVDRASYLWSWLLENSVRIKGKEWSSTNQTYPADKTRYFNGYSVLGLQCSDSQWLPVRGDEGFYRPSQIFVTDLPEGFETDTPRSELVSRLLGFQQQVDPKLLADAMGLMSAEEAQEVTELVRGRSIEELRTLLNRDRTIVQPTEAVKDPARRRRGIIEHRDNAPSKESIVLERSVQPNLAEELLKARAYLRSKYTNAKGELVCQCCHDEMPFKINDLHYFEAIQCVRGLKTHQFENRLALCPVCSAMYRHARETADDEIRQHIIDLEIEATSPSGELTVSLAGHDYSLYFVGTHWFDLKTILEVAK